LDVFDKIMPYNIFGPVLSRRLGRSLGVDLIPYKTCSFDCVYCELGPTTCHTKERRSYKDADDICNELKYRLEHLEGAMDFITLTGSGEPTLNSNLGSIIDRIKTMTDCPLAILTNSSLLYDPLVRAELKLLDLIVPSLDAVSTEIFQRINRPVEGIETECVIEGLIRLREEFSGEIWLEILICDSINDHDSELGLIKRELDAIKPDRVQLNTVFRPPSLKGIRPVSEERLKEIEAFMGSRARAVGRVQSKEGRILGSRSLRTRILILLERRPCTIDDISDSLCMSKIEIVELLDQMMEKGEIVKICHQSRSYYKANVSGRE
jgi:wyosine [tRNA(Phe)-imidazoG37] synthetase (radical SAM superfamily)